MWRIGTPQVSEIIPPTMSTTGASQYSPATDSHAHTVDGIVKDYAGGSRAVMKQWGVPEPHLARTSLTTEVSLNAKVHHIWRRDFGVPKPFAHSLRLTMVQEKCMYARVHHQGERRRASVRQLNNGTAIKTIVAAV